MEDKEKNQLEDKESRWTKATRLLGHIGRTAGTIFGFAVEPGKFIDKFRKLMEFIAKNRDRFILIIRKGSNGIITGKIKGTDESVLGGRAIDIELLDRRVRIKVPTADVEFYGGPFKNREELTDAIETFRETGIIKEGSLHLTYKGITYLASESLLILLRENRQLISYEKIERLEGLEETATKIQENPYNASLLHTFLESLTSLHFNLPNSELDLQIVESLSDYISSMLSSIIIGATRDEDMRGSIRAKRN